MFRACDSSNVYVFVASESGNTKGIWFGHVGFLGGLRGLTTKSNCKRCCKSVQT